MNDEQYTETMSTEENEMEYKDGLMEDVKNEVLPAADAAEVDSNTDSAIEGSDVSETDSEQSNGGDGEQVVPPEKRKNPFAGRGPRQSEYTKTRDIVRKSFQDDMAKGKIISIDGTLKDSTSTEARRVQETARDLLLSNMNRTKLTAVLSEVLIPRNLPPVPVAKYKEFRIMFNPADFVNFKSLSDNPDIRNGQIRSRLQKRIGSEVDFIVESVENFQGSIKDNNVTELLDPKNRLARGNRRAVMLQKQNQFWFSDGTDKSSAVVIGSMVETRIVSVRPELLTVEALGVEIDIPVRDVGSSYIADLTEDEKYAVGGTVVVKITDIDYDGEEIRAKASIRALTADVQMEEANRIAKLLDQQGTLSVAGEVVRINDMNTTVQIRLDSGAVCRCRQNTNGKNALIGDVWLVKINRANTDNGNLDGFLTHFIR